jgi:hypothetical protein
MFIFGFISGVVWAISTAVAGAFFDDYYHRTRTSTREEADKLLFLCILGTFLWPIAIPFTFIRDRHKENKKAQLEKIMAEIDHDIATGV